MCVWILISSVAVDLHYLELIKLTTFVFVIANVVAWIALVLDKAQFTDQVRIRLKKQLINAISEVFQKLL